MADIAAANITNKNRVICGNLVLWTATVKGDGSGTTLKIPVGAIKAVATGNIDDAGGLPVVGFSGNTITYGAAPGSNESHSLWVLGTE